MHLETFTWHAKAEMGSKNMTDFFLNTHQNYYYDF